MIWFLGFSCLILWFVSFVIMLMCLARCRPLIMDFSDVFGMTVMALVAPAVFLYVGIVTMWDEGDK